MPEEQRLFTLSELQGKPPAEKPTLMESVQEAFSFGGPPPIDMTGREDLFTLTELQGTPDTKVAPDLDVGWKELADLVLGLPAWVGGKVGATLLMDAEMLLAGEDEPLGTAEKFIGKQLERPWYQAVSTPVQTLLGKDTEETIVGGALEDISGAIERASEYWSERTGNPEWGAALRQLVDLGMLGTGSAVKTAWRGMKPGSKQARVVEKARADLKAAETVAKAEALQSDPFFDRFYQEPPTWMTEEGLAAFEKGVKADPKVQEQAAKMTGKPIEKLGQDLIEWKQGKTVEAADFPEMTAKVAEVLNKPVDKLTGGDRALLQDFNERIAAAAVKQGGFMSREAAPYVFAALGAGSLAATVALAKYLKAGQDEVLEDVGKTVLAAGLIGVTKAKRLELKTKLQGAKSDLFRDKILVDLARKGDPAAIEKIYTDNAKPLEGSIATFKLPPGVDAVDIVQTVMERFLGSTIKRPKDAPGGFRGDSQVSTFLFTAVKNEAIKAIQLRKLSETPLHRTVTGEGTIADTGGRSAGAARPLDESIPDPTSNLEAAALNSQLGAKMDQAMQELPKNYREIVERVLLEGKSYAQTAQELGIAEGTVRSGLSRAKDQLQGKLREYSGKEAGKVDPVLMGVTALAGAAAGLGAYLDSDMPLRGAALGAIGVPGFYWARKVGVGEGLDKALGASSTRLGNLAGPAVRFSARRFEMNSMGKTDAALDRIAPFLKLKHKLPDAAKEKLDAALLFAEPGGVAALIKGNRPLVAAWREVQSVLADFERQEIQLGRFKKGLKDYFPRVVKDLEGLKAALLEKQIEAKEVKLNRPLTETERQGISDAYLKEGIEAKLIKANAKSVKAKGRNLTDIESSIIVDNWLKVQIGGAQLPGYAKARRVKMTEDLLQYYQAPTDTLLQYIRAVVEDLETAKFFGVHLKSRKIGGKKATDVNDSIGELVNAGIKDGTISSANAEAVRKILRARFVGGTQTPHVFIQWVRDVTNIALLGNILSAATQIGDAPMSLYHHGLRPTFEALKGKLTGNSQVSTKDFGMVNHVVEEIASAQSSGRYVQLAFKYSTFAAIDQFGKNLNLNAGLIKNQRLAATPEGRAKLAERYGEAFQEEFPQLIQDLQKGQLTEPVKSVLFSELSDAQPISKMEMSELYNAHPNLRILTQMKSFMLKQADVVRRDAYQEIAKGKYVKGAAALLGFGLVLAIAQAPANIVKDFISGRPIDWDLDLVQNLLDTFGINRYTLEKVQRSGRPAEDVADVAIGMLTPPILSMTTGLYDTPKKGVRYIPGIGRVIYDRGLGGNKARAAAERRRSRKNMTKIEKRADDFLKRLERARKAK